MATTKADAIAPDGREILPVILGGDLGIYAIARAFHEEYGVGSVVISQQSTGAIRDSRFIKNIFIPQMDDPDVLVPALMKFAQNNPNRYLMLMANADWLVDSIVESRQILETKYQLPLIDENCFHYITDKSKFSELCASVGLRTPETVTLTAEDLKDPSTVPYPSTGFPLIVKPGNTMEYHLLEFEGKHKIFQVESHEELVSTVTAIRDSGYRNEILIQEFIPGEDHQLRSITGYRDSHGVVTCICTAQVLIEEYTPGARGNPAAMITGPNEYLRDCAVKLLDKLEYKGWGNIDVKIDPRNGEAVFLEINPRIGRNNFYVTASGGNVAKFIVEDQVFSRQVEPQFLTKSVLYRVVPIPLIFRYILDKPTRRQIWDLVRSRNVVNPLGYKADRGLRRIMYQTASLLNQYRKFLKYHPRPDKSAALD